MSFDILNNARNMLGPIDAEIRQRIIRALVDPNNETWDNAYSILIRPNKTLWQAWLDTDPAAPRSKPYDGPWPRVPTTFVLYRAITNALGRGE